MKIQVQPTLVIGLGGTGAMALSSIKTIANQLFIDPRQEFPLLRYLAIDTEFITSPGAKKIQSRFAERQSGETRDTTPTGYFQVGLERSEKIAIGVEKSSMQQWLQQPQQLGAADFIEPKYMDRVIKGVAGDGAGGFGIVGKAAFWQHLEQIKSKIEEELNMLSNLTHIERKLAAYKDTYELSSQHQLNIFIICSTGGGTGKGTFLPTAVLVRELLLKMGIANSDGAEIILVNYTPSCFGVSGRNVGSGYMKSIQSNQFASMKELDYVLRYGYPLEEKMKQVLSIKDRDRSNQIYTNVLQVAAQLENSGAYIGDYATINRSVAETINGFVFGNMIGDFRAYFRSNKGKFIGDNPLLENHGLQVERVRDYGRIGRFRLTFPIDQLFRYAQQYHAVQLLEDFCQGSLNTSPPTERIAPIHVAEEWTTAFLKGSKQLLRPQPFLTYQQLRQTCATFDHPWLANIQDGIQGCFNNLAMQFVQSSNGLSPLEQRITAFLNRLMNGAEGTEKGLTGTLQQYCFDYGMDSCIAIIDQIIKQYELQFTQQFKGFLASSSANPYYQQHFCFGQNDRNLLSHLEEQRQVLEQELMTYANGASALYLTADTALQSDKTAWEKENNKLWKRITGQAERRLQSAEGILKRLISTAGQLYDKYTTSSRQYMLLYTAIQHHAMLLELKQHLSHNYAMIQQMDSTNTRLEKGLLKTYKDQLTNILNEPKDSLEIRVVGAQASEFQEFAERLRLKGDVRITDKLQEDLRAVSDSLLTSSLQADTLAEAIDEATGVVHTLKAGKSIVQYLSRKIEQGKKTEVKELLLQLLNNAAYLGKLDTSMVNGGNAQVGASSTLIQVQDSGFITREFADIMGNTKVVQTDNTEEIIITKMETALPLFVFKEFVEGGQLYAQQTADNPMAQYEKHTHQRFVSIPEPFGVPTEMPDIEQQLFLQILLQLGLIRIVNEEIQFKVNVQSDKAYFQYFYDRSKSKLVYQELERRVSVTTLLAQLNQNQAWFDFFAQRVLQRLEYLYSLTNAATRQGVVDYLKQYFEFDPMQPKHAPCFPPVLLYYLIQYSTMEQLRHRLTNWTPFNNRKFQHLKTLPAFKTAIHHSDRKQLAALFTVPTPFMINDTPRDTSERARTTDTKGKKRSDIPANPFDTTFKKGKKYWVSTADRVYKERLPLEEIIPIILKDEYVMISGKSKPKSEQDWKDWKAIKGLYKAVLKKKNYRNSYN